MLPSRCRPALLAAAVLALFCTLSCAEERKPINKVQANALQKSFFIGTIGDPKDDPEFFWRNYVVDGSEGQELVGIGSWSGVDRIKWEISENMLFARRAYGQNEGADNKGNDPTVNPNGTLVAAYPILSHFDVKRAYNPQTGEELNVIEENTADRPWYEREFFRVDWSVNQVDSPLWIDMFIGKLTGDIKVTPIAYYVSDPGRDDAPHFDAANGYFDVTSKFTVEPVASAYPGLPQCVLLGFYTGNAIDNCDGQEAIVRSSYWRVDQVDPDGDFEPFDNPHAPQDVFGNPGGAGDSISVGITTPPRQSFDPGYGYTDQGMRRLYNLHNIWKQSHQTIGSCKTDVDCTTATGKTGSVCLPSGSCTVPCNYDARADNNGDGSEDQCENRKTGYKGSPGAQCSVRNRCTIPYRDREIRPIAWWLNPDMPDSLQDSFDSSGKKTATGPTEDTVGAWNQAMRLAVARAREVECRRTGGERGDCHQQYFVPGEIEMVSYGAWGIDKVKPQSDDVVVTCHNPVRDYDPEVCGERGATARVGDLRHHFIFYWPYSSRAPWGGIANWNGDPLTGQMIGAAAQVMGRSATLAAAQTRDIIMVANGELGMTDITNGTPADLYQTTLRTGQKRTAMSAEEITRRIASIDVTAAAAAVRLDLDPNLTDEQKNKAILNFKTHTTADPRFLASVVTDLSTVAKPIMGSKIETTLLGPGWLIDSAGMNPSTTLDDSALNAVSPLRGRDPARLNLAMTKALNDLSARGVCTFALGGDGVGNPDVRGVARWFGDPATGIYGDDALVQNYPELKNADLQTLSNKRAQLIYDHLTKETYKGIVLHEIGHGMGMFHNFASSYDATNFNPQYWQLRTNEGTATASCNAKARTGTKDTCMGPRFLDPETDDELGQADESRPGINYWGHTSTMEYQNERFFETVGLGQYDVMTMGALYGRVLQTFDGEADDGVAQADQTDYGYLNFTQLTEDNLVIWTPPLSRQGVLPMHYTELARRIKLFDPARCRDATDAERAQAEWRVVHGKVCAPPPKDYGAWDDFVDDTGPKSIVSASARSAAGNVRWPFRFGQTNNSYVHINPSDAGADPYEVTMETIRKFDYSYPFMYFRRQRRDWYYDALPSITGSRFFDRLRSYHWVTARNTATLPQVSAANLEEFKKTDDTVRSNLLAESAMLDAIVRAIVVPQVGEYNLAAKKYSLGNDRRLFDATTSTSAFSLDASTARFVDPDYDTGPAAGGSWEYLNWISHAGFDVEKSNATMALTDGRPTLVVIDRDTYLDGRNLFINFRTDMSKAVDRLVGGLVAGDWDTIASYLPPGSKQPQIMSFGDDVPTRGANSANSRLLYPNFGYKQQVGAMLWAQLFSALGADLSLSNKLLMYVEGTNNVIDIPDAVKTKFTDPRSGITYVAKLYGPDEVDGKTIDQGVSSRMIAHANALLAMNYDVEKDSAGNPTLDQFGQPTLILDANGEPTVVGDVTTTQGYSDYVGLLDTTVQLAQLLGRSPLWGWSQ